MTNGARLLGRPQFRVAETWHDVPLTKASALLCYLAYAQDWVSRDEILYLFYPDTAEQPARANLRQLLTSLRKLPYGEGLEIEDTRLRCHIATDIDQFKRAMNEEKWSKVLELYKGELLHGFQVHDSSEFDNWLSLERQVLHTAWRKASLTFANELATTERYSLASEILAKVHKADVLDEEVLRGYLETLYSSGQKNEALETFESFRNTLHHELASEPEKSTLELISQIQQHKPLSAIGSVAVKTRAKETKPHHNLPVQPTPFVGRELEKAKLTELLADPTCRLLTIVAPGGMGKTRLALEVAKSQLENVEQVCFVSFAAVASPDLMVYTLADGLELTLFGSKSPKDQVLDYLRNKKMLLVLDNLEHLLTGIDFISDLLTTAPELKILATSRERLQLQAEHVFDLEGLTVPDEENLDAKDFDSLQLFAERAKHNQLDFVLEPNLQAVTRICQLVGGMPLAIELAASWSRLLSPNEIAAELEHSLDILATSTRDLPERHHNMQGVFEASWQRLSEEEQTALRKLSVFQGGFTREAARAITELDLPLLLSLVNKSFVWRDTSGRFSQHPLILQYLQQKAKNFPEEKKQSEEKHGLYYLQMLEERQRDLRTLKQREVREALEKELPNIRAAWDWTLREKRVEEIARYARALGIFVEYHHDHEGADMFRQTVAVLDETNPTHHAALGLALIQQGVHEYFLSYHAQSASELTQRGIALLEPLKEFSGILRGQLRLGVIARDQGEFAKAKEINTTALRLARMYGDPSNIADHLSELMALERNLGPFPEVCNFLHTSLNELRELGDLMNLDHGLTIFGSYLIDNGELDEGEKLLLESIEVSQKTTIAPIVTLTDLARLAYKRGRFQEADKFARESSHEASKLGDGLTKAINLAIQARVKIAQSDLDGAEHLLIASLRVNSGIKIPVDVAHALVVFAELCLARGQVKQGVTWLSFLTRFQAIEKRDRDEGVKLLEKAKAQLSPQEFVQAQEESKSLTLEGIVTGILEQSL